MGGGGRPRPRRRPRARRSAGRVPPALARPLTPAPGAPGPASPRDVQAALHAEREGKPFLLLRDGADAQRIVTLPDDDERLSIGRTEENDLALDWDAQVSRAHAELIRVGGAWTVNDPGLSTNGTFVNGVRVGGRRRLRDGDVVRFGGTLVTFRDPSEATVPGTAVAGKDMEIADLTDTQRNVLISLCRPYRHGGAFATPATNGQIAAEVFLSVDAVKAHLRVLFGKFGLGDLPQNQKRARLVEMAFQLGVVTDQDL